LETALGLPVLFGLIAVALLFDFLNGLHDATNSIATIVSTGVLRPQYAVFWAAFYNFVAFTVFGLHVAQTVGTGIIDPAIVDARVIFAALIGAIIWNLVTWGAGIPSSSSYALIGGLVGAGVAKAGLSAAVAICQLKIERSRPYMQQEPIALDPAGFPCHTLDPHVRPHAFARIAVPLAALK
jgi:inorganic phosphate transporter, PiT family